FRGNVPRLSDRRLFILFRIPAAAVPRRTAPAAAADPCGLFQRLLYGIDRFTGPAAASLHAVAQTRSGPLRSGRQPLGDPVLGDHGRHAADFGHNDFSGAWIFRLVHRARSDRDRDRDAGPPPYPFYTFSDRGPD